MNVFWYNYRFSYFITAYQVRLWIRFRTNLTRFGFGDLTWRNIPSNLLIPWKWGNVNAPIEFQPKLQHNNNKNCTTTKIISYWNCHFPNFIKLRGNSDFTINLEKISCVKTSNHSSADMSQSGANQTKPMWFSGSAQQNGRKMSVILSLYHRN